MDEIVNRVAASSLVTLDLDKFYKSGERVELDISAALDQGLVLREKNFREWIRSYDWEKFRGHHVAVTCSTDALVPAWAFMLIASALQPVAASCILGNKERLEEYLFLKELDQVDWSQYRDARVLVKGCSHVEVPAAVFMEAAARLRPVARSVMFGEACSSVPVFKQKD